MARKHDPGGWSGPGPVGDSTSWNTTPIGSELKDARDVASNYAPDKLGEAYDEHHEEVAAGDKAFYDANPTFDKGSP
jgi:hypothetical protein